MSEALVPTEAPSSRVTIVQPRKGWQRIDLRELIRYRDLLWILALRDIKVRYKQTALGVVWAVLQPLLSVAVFAFIFGTVLRVPERAASSEMSQVPYFVFLFSGQLPWILFASTVSAAGVSLVAEADMLRKIYFPRLLVPLAASGAPLVDFFVGFIVFLGVMIAYDVEITWRFALTPLLLFSILIAAWGTGILLSAMTVAYRDFRHVLPFMIQLWFFLTPVIYPVDILPAAASHLLYLNPMYGPIEAFRAAILGTELNFVGWGISTAVGVTTLVIGLAYFSRVEHWFADIA